MTTATAYGGGNLSGYQGHEPPAILVELAKRVEIDNQNTRLPGLARRRDRQHGGLERR